MPILDPRNPQALLASELYRDDYVALLADGDGLIIRMVRSRVLHPSPQAMTDSYANVVGALDALGRARRVLLTDMREAVGRNEPEYEPVLRRFRLAIDTGFMRVGVLLRTAVGALQMRRFAEEEGIVRLISTNEAEIVHYLKTGNVLDGAQLVVPKVRPEPPKRR